MGNINVNFVHPTDGGFQAATIDDTMTVQELIHSLVDEQFIPGPESDIELMLKGSENLLLGDQTLNASNVKEGSTLKVVMATNAGNRS